MLDDGGCKSGADAESGTPAVYVSGGLAGSCVGFAASESGVALASATGRKISAEASGAQRELGPVTG